MDTVVCQCGRPGVGARWSAFAWGGGGARDGPAGGGHAGCDAAFSGWRADRSQRQSGLGGSRAHPSNQPPPTEAVDPTRYARPARIDSPSARTQRAPGRKAAQRRRGAVDDLSAGILLPAQGIRLSTLAFLAGFASVAPGPLFGQTGGGGHRRGGHGDDPIVDCRNSPRTIAGCSKPNAGPRSSSNRPGCCRKTRRAARRSCNWPRR